MKVSKYAFRCSNCNELGWVAKHQPNFCFKCGCKVEIFCELEAVNFVGLVKYFNDNVKYESDLVRNNKNIPQNIKDFMLSHEYRILQVANETFAKLRDGK